MTIAAGLVVVCTSARREDEKAGDGQRKCLSNLDGGVYVREGGEVADG